MDQYISTYQKDYAWPSRKMQHTSPELRDGGSCRCKPRPPELKVTKVCGDQMEWSRQGPMGRLLDPKLYPAKTGPHPESEATKFDQPDTYLKKLEEKHPNLYGIVQSTTEDEVMMRVDQDRLKTTYQVDYGGEKSSQMCTSDDSTLKRSQKEEVSPRLEHIKKQREEKKHKSKMKRKDEDEPPETRIPAWRSEYQDNISKLGGAIMKHRLHQRKTAAPSWAMAV
ncbi:hypothetical protein WN55_08333 [Dufourea novaeangliae]|uniref:Uncharacterized protein n=1 Tax=Dufourea novaeangliae TaxID=178035 RepID=A0A154P6S0_DUFNO|nr:hypothetical protein WN55_08333 [Dufourea novaeangliae]